MNAFFEKIEIGLKKKRNKGRQKFINYSNFYKVVSKNKV
ncbi:hypothetical protein LEP1GSC107_4660 [Leptospira interrogans serovar Grippotyphosa str. UI 12769]|uniref:Uncharacterized protein n=1 Tax=Leptospira interrogans serovar Lora str. TE 1992 TaxID=1193028 RepID=M3DMS6_LEPIR|nr:hypothetical protein LEP1GSC067_4522 [Leptospira interrogans serovar Lora str. TE 1992]EMF73031.1 hypothetical protein LEP1GSC148_2244 [Leptospira interrogans serovar Canicola str. LT1962]EMM90738.1 hypothetical protein LEP1GSC145_3518 [Leptospira interrogans serovar Djasiman str. LT1649]EMN86831.1 hypothetical protein LEP1GSC107_4660 [Leptospira interrogans serovar Grippotyphosa str. UI 12769]